MSNNAYVQSVLQQKFGQISNGLQADQLATQMATIVQQVTGDGIKIISVVGGAASGKSTIAEELVANLQKDNITSDMLCTDNYIVGDREFRQETLKHADAQKKYDFALMDRHIVDICKLQPGDKPVSVPVIDSKTGVSVHDKRNFTHQVECVQVLVIEGDFPRDDYDLRFYLHVPDDQRLQNNIDRETEQSDDDIDKGELARKFNDRQRTLHKPYTLPALQSADYVLVADVSKDDWRYSMYQRNQ